MCSVCVHSADKVRIQVTRHTETDGWAESVFILSLTQLTDKWKTMAQRISVYLHMYKCDAFLMLCIYIVSVFVFYHCPSYGNFGRGLPC